MIRLRALLLVVVLVATATAPALADFGGEGENPPLPAVSVAAVEPGSDQTFAWFLFAVILYHVFFVPAAPVVLKCWPVGGYIVCRP